MRLQTKLILLICSLVFGLILLIAYVFQEMEARTLKDQIGQRALTVAKTVASIPAIKEAFEQPEPWNTIQPIVEEIRIKSGAEFVVVGNTEGIRYSHPIPERIGKEMVGGDNQPVLEGKEIISQAVGSLGPSLRGKAPILDHDGKVIGIVSVGFMIEDIEETILPYRNKILLLGLVTLLIGSIGATLIAHSVKRAIFGLEPEEIGTLCQEKQAILQSIREGILAINPSGIVTAANQTAVGLLGLPEGIELQGKHIFEILPSSRLVEVLHSGKAEFDQEMIIGDQVVIANRLPVLDHHGQVMGAVASFRNKSDLYRVTEELLQVRRYAEALRAQTREFSNKLYMISGLIQLESYQEAIELITRESNVHQSFLHFIMKEIPDPMIGGLLIGKFNRAIELKVNLEIDRESSFRDVPVSVNRNHLVTILGNLLDNAMEAVMLNESDRKTVNVILTDLGDDLIIEVEDNGIGIKEEHSDRIFDVGYSTKSQPNRGYGLALVKQAISQLHGYITFTCQPEGGAIFTVAIPKKTSQLGQMEAV